MELVEILLYILVYLLGNVGGIALYTQLKNKYKDKTSSTLELVEAGITINNSQYLKTLIIHRRYVLSTICFLDGGNQRLATRMITELGDMIDKEICEVDKKRKYNK